MDLYDRISSRNKIFQYMGQQEIVKQKILYFNMKNERRRYNLLVL